MDKINLSLAKESFGRVVYTHKTHEKAAEIYFFRSKLFNIINILVLTLTSSSALITLLQGDAFKYLTSFLAVVSLFLGIFQYVQKYTELGEKHVSTAKQLWLIREKYQNLIADIINERWNQEITNQTRDALLAEYFTIIQNAPATNHRAYQQARKALKINEEMTFSEDEIENLLPAELRKNFKE